MTTIKEAAQAYVPPQTRNISELEKVPINMEVTEETHIKKETGEEFTVKVIEVEGEKYRLPNSVLNGIKAIMERMPNLTHISVLKSGTGLATTYQVLPLSGV